MPCKEEILSNDYADLIIDFMLSGDLLNLPGPEYCYEPLDDEFGFAYVRRNEAPALTIGNYSYGAIPKLYGLMQIFNAENLVEMGNLRIQNPPLSLQGDGVIMGFIDTGERVIILSS